MADNEKTSPRVATIASKIMSMEKPFGVSQDLWEEIKTLAGSALTQAPDKFKETILDPVTWAAVHGIKGFENIGRRRPIGYGIVEALKNYE